MKSKKKLTTTKILNDKEKQLGHNGFA